MADPPGKSLWWQPRLSRGALLRAISIKQSLPTGERIASKRLYLVAFSAPSRQERRIGPVNGLTLG
jgi:hypothetical protein